MKNAFSPYFQNSGYLPGRVALFWMVMAAFTLVAASLPDYFSTFEMEEVELADKTEKESKEETEKEKESFEKELIISQDDECTSFGVSYLSSHDASFTRWANPIREIVTPPPEYVLV